MPTVFIPQEPVRRDRDTGKLTTFMDLTPAARFGDMKVLLPNGGTMFQAQPMVNTMKRELHKFCDDDHVLCVGDPSAIGIAVALAAQSNRGRVKLLKWDRKIKSYISQEVTI